MTDATDRLKQWLADWRAYRADPLARELRKLPWVTSRRDALKRARSIRLSDEATRRDLRSEFRALWLDSRTIPL